MRILIFSTARLMIPKVYLAKRIELQGRLLLITIMSTFFWTSLKGQAPNSWAKDVVMDPPNTAAFEKYGEIPVNLSSGLSDIEVPIFSIADGPVSHSISLSYHASGIRVGETASWVGLGWNLQAGGLVSREVLGFPDEANGYWYTGDAIDTSSVAYLSQVAGGSVDAEADIFSFNIPGANGKFFFDKNNDIQVIPLTDVKIEYEFTSNDGFESFTLVAVDGTQYHFGKVGNTTAYEYMQAGLSGSSWRSSWMLLKIESDDGNYAIHFSYTPENYSYKSLANCKYALGDVPGMPTGVSCAGNNGADIPYHEYVLHIMNGQRLTQISTEKSDQVVDFLANTTRLDLPTYRLDEISLTTNQSVGTNCRKFTFGYDYFEDNTHSLSSAYPYFKRLKLLSLLESTCDNLLDKEPYLFSYEGPWDNGKQFMPHRLSKAIDHWGYYNGKHDNNNEDAQHAVNVPPTSLTHPNLGTPLSYGIANRDTDETFMKYGTLNQITYPTGGNTSFVHEANTASILIPGTINYLIHNQTTCGTPGSACCGNLTDTQVVSFTDDAQLLYAFFDLEIIRNPFPPGDPESCGPGNENTYVKLEILEGSTLKGMIEHTLDTSASSYKITGEHISTIAILQPNINYTFKLSSTNGKAIANVYHQAMTQSNEAVGGLRIKEIRSHDGQSTSNDILKEYFYLREEGSSHTSGILMFTPEYGLAGLATCVPSYYFEMYSTASFFPMGNYDGRHIAYSRVVEQISGNGKTVYHFQMDPAPIIYPILGPSGSNETIDTYGKGWRRFLSLGSVYGPTPPQPFKATHGQLAAKISYDENNNALSTENIDHVLPGYTTAPGQFLKVSFLVNHGSSGCNYYGFISYKPRTGAYLVEKETHILDEVTQQTTYGYTANLRHVQPITIAHEKSDGRVQQQLFKYPLDYQENLVVGNGSNITIQDMLDQNIVGLPIETQIWEGLANDLQLIKGELTAFKNYGTSNDPIIRPFTVSTVETASPISASSVSNTKDTNDLFTVMIPSPRYNERAEVNYDSMGLINAQKLTNDPANTVYLWGYDHSLPVAKVVGALTHAQALAAVNSAVLDAPVSEAVLRAELTNLRTAFPNALVTTMTYNNQRLLGSMTGPDGVSVYYSYDGLGRLVKTQDDDLNILHTTKYHFGQD